MAADIFGYRSGLSIIRRVKVANTSAISVGDILKRDGAGSQYFTRCGAGDTAACVARGACAQPTNDGDTTIEAEFSLFADFEYPPDTGTVSESMIGKTMDIGGAQSINIDASAVDNVICVGVNVEKNTGTFNFLFNNSLAGVA